MQVGTDLRTEMMLADSPNYAGNPWRVFRGTAEQIRLVRTFVKIVFAGHRAVDDAVLVASEITTNSVDHSLSGMPGGLFLVHLARFSAYSVGIMVTDEGGTAQPHEKEADVDCESGRGLAVVRSLSSTVAFATDEGMQSVLAIISAGGSHETWQEMTGRNAEPPIGGQA